MAWGTVRETAERKMPMPERAQHEGRRQHVEQRQAAADRHVEDVVRDQQRHGHLPVGHHAGSG